MNYLENFLVVGLTCNTEKTIVKDLNRIFKIFDKSKKFCVLIIESDSNDKTVSKLEIIKKNNYNFNYISLGNLKNKLPNRIQRLSYCRNIYKKHILLDKKYEYAEYILIMDFDNINYQISKESLISCFENSKWDAVFANQAYKYYDTYALRYLNQDLYQDPWLEFFNDRKKNSYFKSIVKFYSKMPYFKKNRSWIRVKSAFGGAAIYKKKCFLYGKYKTFKINEHFICEHVYFNHLLFRKNMKLFINPNFINSGINWHSLKSSFFFKLIFFLIYILGDVLRAKLKKKGFISHI